MNIVEIYERFPKVDDCYAHLEKVRWGDKPHCPKCGADTVCRKSEANQRDRWQCWSCKKAFSVTAGTIFHNSHIDLRKWYLLISLMLNAKKGLSACQAARDLGNMRRPTVWSMMHRIRKAMNEGDMDRLCGLVQADECYVGGKPRKGKKYDNDDDKPKPGRGTKKTPVVGLAETGGRAKTFVVTKRDLAAKPLADLIRRNVVPQNTVLMTDEYRPYALAGKEMIAHERVNHSAGEYTRGIITTNEIEGLWAIVKRAVIGQFHRVSVGYLPAYLDEITYRYNRRQVAQGDIFSGLLTRAVAVR